MVLGAARSGKSRWAEHLAQGSGLEVIYVATAAARPADQSWQERLRRHRERRPDTWQLREPAAPQELAECLLTLRADQLALVDSLGTWVAGTLDRDNQGWLHLCEELCQALRRCRSPVVLVSEQTGWGVVPPTAIGGLFRDRLGCLERRLVANSDRSWLVVAGRALDLQALGQPVPAD